MARKWQVVAQYGEYDDADSMLYIVKKASSAEDAIMQAAAADKTMSAPVKDANGDYRGKMNEGGEWYDVADVLWSAARYKEADVVAIHAGYQHTPTKEGKAAARAWAKRKHIEKWAGTWLWRANEAAGSGDVKAEQAALTKYQVWLDKLNELDGMGE